jgi:hypothetical protein
LYCYEPTRQRQELLDIREGDDCGQIT